MEQVDFACGEGVPQQCHLQRVVADLTFVLADVLDNLVRMDDGSDLKNTAGAAIRITELNARIRACA